MFYVLCLQSYLAALPPGPIPCCDPLEIEQRGEGDSEAHRHQTQLGLVVWRDQVRLRRREMLADRESRRWQGSQGSQVTGNSGTQASSVDRLVQPELTPPGFPGADRPGWDAQQLLCKGGCVVAPTCLQAKVAPGDPRWAVSPLVILQDTPRAARGPAPTPARPPAEVGPPASAWRTPFSHLHV